MIPVGAGIILSEYLVYNEAAKLCKKGDLKFGPWFYVINNVVYGATAFFIFAYFDSVCLWAGLYERAPTPENLRFEEDRLLLGNHTHILDQSSFNYNNISTLQRTKTSDSFSNPTAASVLSRGNSFSGS